MELIHAHCPSISGTDLVVRVTSDRASLIDFSGSPGNMYCWMKLNRKEENLAKTKKGQT
jgi:hypothetical protein